MPRIEAGRGERDSLSDYWKAVMEVKGQKVQESVGSLQLCAGQPVGVESAIHTMRNFLDDDSSDGILLIDADNAFNRVNRKVALWNVQFTCPVMKHVLINFYRSPTRIFMKGEGALSCCLRKAQLKAAHWQWSCMRLR